MPENSLVSSQKLISEYLTLLRRSPAVPEIAVSALSDTLPARDLSRSCALVFSPHPDDECLTGALPLRLHRENWQIVNIAVSLGSTANVARREKKNWRRRALFSVSIVSCRTRTGLRILISRASPKLSRIINRRRFLCRIRRTRILRISARIFWLWMPWQNKRMIFPAPLFKPNIGSRSKNLI